MINTLARALVAVPVIPASTSDPDEIHPTPDDATNTGNTPIARPKAEILSRKEQREAKKLAKTRLKEAQEIASRDALPSSKNPRKSTDHASANPDRDPDINSHDEDDDEDAEDSNLSRKQRKKIAKALRRQQQKLNEPQPSTTSAPPPSTTTPPAIPAPSTPKMPPTPTFPLLVCSIGNPGPQYASTLHSAGHTILTTIRDRGLYNPFQRGLSGSVATPNTTRMTWGILGFTKDDGSKGLGPEEDDFTLWQSTKLMNISGPSVHAAYRSWMAQLQRRTPPSSSTSSSSSANGNGKVEGRLVVVHDELESELGKISIKSGTASPRGHNGLKSVQASMGGQKWWRVGVGIGRPESRDPVLVSQYVLRKMTPREEKVLDKAAVGVLMALRKIAEGKA